MAALTPTSTRNIIGPASVTSNTLTASDTLVVAPGAMAIFNNTGGSPLTVNIKGSTATTSTPVGIGKAIDLTTGYDITVAAGTQKIIKLDTISAYLQGTVTLTGASGLLAIILNP